MSDMIKIAVDAMGGDGSPKKIIDELNIGSIDLRKSSLRYRIIGQQTVVIINQPQPMKMKH